MAFNSFPEFANNDAPPMKAYTKVYDYDGSNNLIYEGWAQYSVNGNVTSNPIWAIKKYTYSGSNLIASKWANGSTDEINIWDNRTSLTYN